MSSRSAYEFGQWNRDLLDLRVTARLPDGKVLNLWYKVLLIGDFVGFPVASFIAGYFDLESRTVTLPYHVCMLAISLFCIGLALRAYPMHHFRAAVITPAIVFWIAYSYRFCIDTFYDPVMGQYVPQPVELTLMIYGICIPIFIATLAMPDIQRYGSAMKWILLGYVVSCALGLQLNWAALQAGAVGERLSGNSVMNPISFGHCGTSAILLSVYSLGLISKKECFRGRVPLSIAGIFIGGAVLVLAVSRGALAGLVIALPLTLFLIIIKRRRSKVWAAVVLLALWTAVPVSLNYADHFGINIDRFTETHDDSSSNRLMLLDSAWKQFQDHPILGDRMYTRDFLTTYPHNTVVEAFMATGLVGGSCYLIIKLVALCKATRLLRRRPELAWISILFFQYLALDFFSGCLYADPIGWASLGMLLVCRIPRTGYQFNGDHERTQRRVYLA